jgi:glycosyltransferase involved in cell wall biosynthesis
MGENLNRKVIVVSAINIFEGGPLTIFKNNLKFLNNTLGDEYKVIALVHRIALFPIEELNKITFFEFPKSRKSYFLRLYFEYYYFKKLSNLWKPYLWLSLHDITPNVISDVRVVYCHNPTPFKKKSISDLFFLPIIFFFSLFYKFLYQINIKNNKYIVVQQVWLKNAFVNLFGLKKESVLVCYPETEKIVLNTEIVEINSSIKKNDFFIFFYPALARPFKNFEIIGDAVKLLINKGIINFEVVITITGDENNYSKYIFKKYKNLKQLKFVGMLSFQDVNEMYKKVDVLLFPSTLETWGLPITEFKAHNKPIILSKLPYAYETLGVYDKGCFFDPLDANELAEKMAFFISGTLNFDLTPKIKEKVLIGWAELFDKILEK